MSATTDFTNACERSEKPRKDEAETLPLDELFALFAGRDAWHFQGVPSLDYPPLQVADCGHGITLVAPPYGSATCFPTSVGMAATWNRDLLEQAGKALGRETRAKDCAMLLGPMVNLHRLPCGGRNYETFSEDPVLTGKMAAALIRGIQAEGAGACIKSFACNNQQHEQKTTSSDVDPKTLRELYLKVFRVAFEESDPWAVMTSYNPVNGEHPADSRYWIEEVLRGELGYEGMVVSDWRAIQSDRAIQSGVDIEMPGPGKILTAARLQSAVDEGLVTLEELQVRARRILELHRRCSRVREVNAPFSPPELDSPRHRALCRQVAEESITLLKNERALLPLDRNKIRKLAILGPNAATARLGGGGSASVSPFYAVSPLEGIRRSAGDTVAVVYREGCSMGSQLPSVPADCFRPNFASETGGLKGEYYEVAQFDSDGDPAKIQIDPAIDFSWGWAAPATGLPREFYAVRWVGLLELPQAGDYTFALSTQEGIGRIWFEDELVLDAWSDYDVGNFEAGYTNRSAEFVYHAKSAGPLPVRIEYRKTGTRGGIHFGWKAPFEDDPVQEAVSAAQQADAAVVVAGLCNIHEGGAYDRKTFALPGRQAELIRAVAAVNPRTIVVLINGTPVDCRDWLAEVPALLEAYYPGQEGGNALGRILFGDVNPSGKLPDTIPSSWEEVPAMRFYPGVNGSARFGEGLMVGYRHYDQAGIEPVFPFGFGLSYTTFEIGVPGITGRSADGGWEVRLEVRNTGDRAGAEVVQLYLEWVDPREGRPPRALLDFAKVFLQPGECREMQFTVRPQDLRTYHPERDEWELEGNGFRIAAGPDSRRLQSCKLGIVAPCWG